MGHIDFMLLAHLSVRTVIGNVVQDSYLGTPFPLSKQTNLVIKFPINTATFVCTDSHATEC